MDNNKKFWKEDAVVLAIRQGNPSILKEYLGSGLNMEYLQSVNLDTRFMKVNSEFSCESFPLPLVLLCNKRQGMAECLALLLDNGMKFGSGLKIEDFERFDYCDVLEKRWDDDEIEKEYSYRSPMHLAVISQNWDAVNILLDRGYSCMDRDPSTNLLPGEQAMLCDEYGMAIKLKVHAGLVLDEVVNKIPLLEDFDFGN